MSARQPHHLGALLTVDLRAICANWRMLKPRLSATEWAAVVKAEAYGLGALKVAPALYEAGCRHFFVAHMDEAIALRTTPCPAGTIGYEFLTSLGNRHARSHVTAWPGSQKQIPRP